MAGEAAAEGGVEAAEEEEVVRVEVPATLVFLKFRPLRRFEQEFAKFLCQMPLPNGSDVGLLEEMLVAATSNPSRGIAVAWRKRFNDSIIGVLVPTHDHFPTDF